MPKIGQLQATPDSVKHVTITDGLGTPVNLSYAADRMSVNVVSEFKNIMNGAVPDDEGVTILAQLLSEVLVSWDIEENDSDDILPINIKTLSRFGIGMLYVFFYGVMGDMQPPKQNGTTSISSLGRKAGSGPSRTGSRTSKPRKSLTSL